MQCFFNVKIIMSKNENVLLLFFLIKIAPANMISSIFCDVLPSRHHSPSSLNYFRIWTRPQDFCLKHGKILPLNERKRLGRRSAYNFFACPRQRHRRFATWNKRRCCSEREGIFLSIASNQLFQALTFVMSSNVGTYLVPWNSTGKKLYDTANSAY